MSILSIEDRKEFQELADIANRHLYNNDKRVATAFDNALEKLESIIALKDKDLVLPEFEEIIGYDWIEDLMLACHNTGQHDRALYICDRLEKNGILSEEELMQYRVEFLASSGKTRQAEQLVKERLEKDEDSVYLYVMLGDIYYINQIQEEKYDLDKAEKWYYKAYDRGLANTGDWEAKMLLKRLGAVCVDRLRREKENKLLLLLQKLNIGGWETLAQLKMQVYLQGNDAILFHHLQGCVVTDEDPLEEVNRRLHIITDAYNYMSQNELNGMSPFEMGINFPKGYNTQRIQNEMLTAYTDFVENNNSKEQMEVQYFEGFSQFQKEFLKQEDPQTGKKRNKIVDEEHKKAVKDYEDGKRVWTGFLEFRQ